MLTCSERLYQIRIEVARAKEHWFKWKDKQAFLNSEAWRVYAIYALIVDPAIRMQARVALKGYMPLYVRILSIQRKEKGQ